MMINHCLSGAAKGNDKNEGVITKSPRSSSIGKSICYEGNIFDVDDVLDSVINDEGEKTPRICKFSHIAWKLQRNLLYLYVCGDRL